MKSLIKYLVMLALLIGVGILFSQSNELEVSMNEDLVGDILDIDMDDMELEQQAIKQVSPPVTVDLIEDEEEYIEPTAVQAAGPAGIPSVVTLETEEEVYPVQPTTRLRDGLFPENPILQSPSIEERIEVGEVMPVINEKPACGCSGK